MIVDPRIEGYNFSELAGKTNLEINGIYDYYSNLDTIKTKLGTKDIGYLYAPLKEPYFEINANTRMIKVPDIFKANGIGVIGDKYAETICFSIDRYFDTVDLNNESIKAYIYWTLEGNSAEEKQEGKDKAYFIDPVAKKDYLIIGWPLNGDKFNYAGNLKFYISFEDDLGSYKLNTLTATVKVNDNLKIEAEADQGDQYTEFVNLYYNSNITAFERTIPDAPKLLHDIGVIDNGKFVNDLTGSRKENTGIFGVQFDIDTGKNFNIEFHQIKNGTDKVLSDTQSLGNGIYTHDITEPGKYYFKAYYDNGTVLINNEDNEDNENLNQTSILIQGIETKTSTITVMSALSPILENLEYVNTLPYYIKEATTDKVIYLDNNFEEDKVLVTATINDLDYSADTSGLNHNSTKDYGIFSLEDNFASKNNDGAFKKSFILTNKKFILELTKEDLNILKDHYDASANTEGDTPSNLLTLTVIHKLNGDTAEIDFPLNLASILTENDLVKGFVDRTTAEVKVYRNGQFKLQLDKTIQATESDTNEYTYQWQYLDGKNWRTIDIPMEEPWNVGATIGSYSGAKKLNPNVKDNFKATINSLYRLNIIRTAGFTKTESINPQNILLNPTDFYTLTFDTDVFEETETTP